MRRCEAVADQQLRCSLNTPKALRSIPNQPIRIHRRERPNQQSLWPLSWIPVCRVRPAEDSSYSFCGRKPMKRTHIALATAAALASLTVAAPIAAADEFPMFGGLFN